MRWLTVGPFPPAVGAGAVAALDEVRRRVRAGDDVEVVAPAPSAADHVVDLSGATGMVRLRRHLRGRDGLWLRLDDGIALTPGSGRAALSVELAALATVLRRVGTAVVDVGDVGLLPGGRLGRLVLASGATFVVDDEEAAALLIERGAPADRVRFRAPSTHPPIRPSDLEWHQDGAGDGPRPRPVPVGGDRVALEAWIRDRAGPGAAVERATRTPLHLLAPLEMPVPPPGVRRGPGWAVHRVTRWMLDPVVQHVNRLHAATIAALEDDDQES